MPSEPIREKAEAAVTSLRRMNRKATLDGMARYGIPSGSAFGVPVGRIQQLARRLGRDHALAEALWRTGWYEARMLAAFVDQPERVTPAQMDRWCRDFDSWAICDTVCFHLFDRSPHAWSKVERWCGRREEFVKRGGFALLACLALHEEDMADKWFLNSLRWIERGATDERNFVKKGVLWALRGVGQRSVALHADAMTLARRLSNAPEAAARWVGKAALKELASPATARRIAARGRGAKGRGASVK